MKATCKNCGKEYKPKAKDRVSFCSRECYQMHKKAGTGLLHLVKDYPSYILDEYGHIRRIVKTRTDLVECVDCGALIKKGRKYCDTCVKRQWVKQYKRDNKHIWDEPRTCIVCGSAFTKQYGHTSIACCYLACTKQNRKEHQYACNIRRDSRLKNQHIERIYRKKVYKRDHWRCQICGKRVNPNASAPHPKAPTIDHIIPISEGGEHSYRNVRTAHFMCNSLRGSNATRQGDQVMLFG